MDAMETVLPAPKLAKLRAAYKRGQITVLLKATLPRLYAHSKGYVDAIAAAFYDDLPEDGCAPENRQTLTIQDRERCLIALLASRRQDFDLAVHVYVGLMEGITPGEIANIMLLAGMYTGIDSFARGIYTAIGAAKVLAALVDAGGAIDAPAVGDKLRATFPG